MGGIPNSERIVRLKDGRTRRFRSIGERREIVEETMKPGASVALIARAHGVNANQVFKWRRQYQQGQLGSDSVPAVLPVKVCEKTAEVQPISRRRSRGKTSGIIDIDLGHARVRIEGTADPECIRAALAGLVR